MKTANIPTSHDRRIHPSLHDLVDQLTQTLLAGDFHNGNTIVNNVPTEISTGPGEFIIASVIHDILRAVVINTFNGTLFISARQRYNSLIDVTVKDDNCYNAYAVALGLQETVAAAKTVGGQLTIINPRKRETIISFTFPAELQRPG